MVHFSKEELLKELMITEINQRVEEVNISTTLITGENEKKNRAIFTTIDKDLKIKRYVLYIGFPFYFV